MHPHVSQLSPIKQALLTIEALESRIQELESAPHEAIAVVGMGCRFPGDANDPQAYWELLRSGRNTISPRSDRQTYPGHYLREVGWFDPDFFGIAPREAEWMDPQQQLLLEVCVEALEHAQFALSSLMGSRTGVYMGIMNQDYARISADQRELSRYVAAGSESSFLAGRLSYLFGLHGPSMTISTACSSSLVTTHLACRALRGRECDLALAGGVSLILTPDASAVLAEMQATAPDGQCKTFDASADGYGRGEGCGVLILKRLSDAQRDGDTIWAVIRGSAVNHDGRSGGLTVPNGIAQEALLRAALADAQLDPQAISYVEAHGTGTHLGDPIEVRALGNVLAQERQEPLLVGSVKTNIGHLEAAAGVAGLLKTILALHHRQIPPHLHFRQPNPLIPWQQYPIQVPTSLTEWLDQAPRRAGVSSFGLSGINAHIILEEAPHPAIHPASDARPVHLLTLSAKHPHALTTLAQRYLELLQSDSAPAWGDLCQTGHGGRAHYEHRLALVAADREEAVVHIQDYLAEQNVVGIRTGSAPDLAPKVAFLFTGQGSQFAGMGQELYATQPTFRAAIDRCAELLTGHVDRPLLDILNDPETIDQTAHTQPALFALEYALATLWQSWGVQPNLLIGHSIGELVAACIAGVFSLEDGLKLVAARGRLMGALPQDGHMVAIAADEARVHAAIAPYAEDVSIAAVNGPTSVVISGRTAAVRAIAAQCVAEGIRTQSLTVSHAFHSPLMEPMLTAFRAVAETITYHAPTRRLVSNLTGGLAGNEVTTPDYWVRHVREVVRFGDGVQTLHAQGVEIFLEIGPKPVLLGMVGERGQGSGARGQGFALLPSLRPGQGAWLTLLSSLGAMYVRGVAIDWKSFDRDSVRQKVTLPTYPFQRQQYWVAPATNSAVGCTGASSLLPADIQADELVERLASVGSLSEAERLLLPRLLDMLRNLPEQDKSNVVFDYYNALSHASVVPDQDEDGEETFLTFGPLPQIVPGFSWLQTLADPQRYHEHAALSRAAQIDMRRMLFRKVDFTGCRTVLDFGCGYGSDLLQLAARYPHLALDGYTISSGQAQIGNRRAVRRDVQERLRIYHRDSVRDAFPASYDLAFGFEVVHHIKDKAVLFANLGDHLHEDGLLVLADFISNTECAIEHAETSSYFITRAEWVDLLTRNHLHLIAAINISQEAANYLHDPAFAENLAQIEQGMDPNITSALQSYNQLGKLLRKELASYVLLTAQKRSDLAQEELERRNLAALEQISSYMECSPQQWLYAPIWRPVPDRQEQLDLQGAAGIWLLLAPPPQPSPAGGGSPTPPPIGGRLGGGDDTFQTASNTTVVNIFAERIPPITPPSPPASGGDPMHCSPPLAGGLGGGDSNDNCSTNAPDECGRMLLAGLRRYGGQPVLVTPGDTLAQVAPDHWTVRANAGEDLVALLRAIGRPIRAAVSLWSTGMPTLATTDADRVPADTLANTTAALHLAQALASTANPPQLWFVTRGAVAVRDDDDVQAQQAPVWGLANVVAREHPELHCGRVDLDGTQATIDVQNLLAELLLPDAESQVAYRRGVRHVARLVRQPLVDEIVPLVIDSNASYLITGGLGALGLQVAHGLVEAGARHLVLTGRSGAQGKEASVRMLEQAGARVHVYALDVADPVAVTALVETIRTTLPPLRGIVHAAGVLDDATLIHQSSARLQRVMAPKVAGSWNLHCATAGLPLDFFVCFSSLAALVGSPGQSNYAAANAFMDALAHVRRRSGLPAQSINWGPWAGPGMADTDRARRSHTGVDTISAEQGIALFRALLAQPVTQVGAALIRWSELGTQDDPFFAECIPAEGASAPAHVQSELQQQLRTAAPADYLPTLIAALQVQVSKVLGRSELPAVHQGFMDMGMDSLMSVELRNQLQLNLGIPLSATLMFKYPNVGDLAAYLAQELQPQTPPAPGVGSGLEIAAETPDADIDASIAEELARLTDLLGS